MMKADGLTILDLLLTGLGGKGGMENSWLGEASPCKGKINVLGVQNLIH